MPSHAVDLARWAVRPSVRAVLDVSPGAPGRPPSREDMQAEVRGCAGYVAGGMLAATCDDATVLRRVPSGASGAAA